MSYNYNSEPLTAVNDYLAVFDCKKNKRLNTSFVNSHKKDFCDLLGIERAY